MNGRNRIFDKKRNMSYAADRWIRSIVDDGYGSRKLASYCWNQYVARKAIYEKEFARVNF